MTERKEVWGGARQYLDGAKFGDAPLYYWMNFSIMKNEASKVIWKIREALYKKYNIEAPKSKEYLKKKLAFCVQSTCKALEQMSSYKYYKFNMI